MKKKIPIELRKILDEEYLDIKDIVHCDKSNNNQIISFHDIDKESDYNFSIVEIREGQDPNILIRYCPSNGLSLEPFSGLIKTDGLKFHFRNWKNLLIQANTESPLFDDPITASFKDEYFADFEILDEEKNKPLKIKKIPLLDEYLEKISAKIDEHKNESNSEQISEIKEDIEELRENLSSKSKVWIADKLCWIWAKITKNFPKLIKYLLDPTIKIFFKEVLTQII